MRKIQIFPAAAELAPDYAHQLTQPRFASSGVRLLLRAQLEQRDVPGALRRGRREEELLTGALHRRLQQHRRLRHPGTRRNLQRIPHRTLRGGRDADPGRLHVHDWGGKLISFSFSLGSVVGVNDSAF